MANPVYCVIVAEIEGREVHYEGWLCEHVPPISEDLKSTTIYQPDMLLIQPAINYDPEGIKIGVPVENITMIYPKAPNETVDVESAETYLE